MKFRMQNFPPPGKHNKRGEQQLWGWRDRQFWFRAQLCHQYNTLSEILGSQCKKIFTTHRSQAWTRLSRLYTDQPRAHRIWV